MHVLRDVCASAIQVATELMRSKMNDEILDALLAGFPLPSLAIDRTERIIAANIEALTLINQQARGQNYVTMLRQPALLDAIETTLTDGKARSTQYLSNDGAQDTAFRVSCRAVQGLGRDMAGVVLVSFEDITDKEQAGQMRRDFVANVSHELRTPLTALMGFIETLRGPARDDKKAQQRFLEIMEREATRMSRLIKDLLSLSRVESEERMRPTRMVDLASLVTSATMTLGPQARDNGVSLTVTGADEPIEVPGDADQLLQVFSNLIENAIKYGGGQVQVDITLMERDPALRSEAVRIEVRDNGAGIDPLHLPRLTERFYRVDNHRSREMGGTGLGLAIVKHIVNRHRGRLRIVSEAGQGSRFIVVLPSG